MMVTLNRENRGRRLLGLVAVTFLSLFGGQAVQSQEPRPMVEAGETITRMSQDQKSVSALLQGRWVKNWVAKIDELPTIEPAKIRVGEKEIVVDEALYYLGRYGSPLAYARMLDLAEEHGFKDPMGAKVFDFGYGSIGHLHMLANCGSHVVAVDVDPLLQKIYERGSGPIGSGSLQLLHGRFPAEPTLVSTAGDGFDLFISKNTLKLGYVHPTREPSNPKQVIDLGVDDEGFLAAVSKMLKPGGLFLIYNFCPAKAPADRPYIPWADGECPFTVKQLETAGFDVLVYNQVDDAAARDIAKALKWDTDGGMTLASDLFAWYTVARRRK